MCTENYHQSYEQKGKALANRILHRYNDEIDDKYRKLILFYDNELSVFIASSNVHVLCNSVFVFDGTTYSTEEYLLDEILDNIIPENEYFIKDILLIDDKPIFEMCILEPNL